MLWKWFPFLSVIWSKSFDGIVLVLSASPVFSCWVIAGLSSQQQMRSFLLICKLAKNKRLISTKGRNDCEDFIRWSSSSFINFESEWRYAINRPKCNRYIAGSIAGYMDPLLWMRFRKQNRKTLVWSEINHLQAGWCDFFFISWFVWIIWNLQVFGLKLDENRRVALMATLREWSK